MAQDSKNSILGLIAIAISALVVMGALSFLAVSLLIDVPPLALLAGFFQLLLGLAGCVAGLMLMRGSVAALYVLIVLAVCVVINTAFYVVTFASHAMST